MEKELEIVDPVSDAEGAERVVYAKILAALKAIEEKLAAIEGHVRNVI
jgi:hypothetical protein